MRRSSSHGHRIRTAIGVTMAVAVLAPTIGVLEPGAPPASAAVPIEVESPDFASENYADPWDYSNVEDQNTDAANADSIAVRGGRLELDVTGGDYFSPVTSFGGSLAFGRDGGAMSVDTARYSRLSFRMNQPNSGVGAFYWFTCRELLPSCSGGVTFSLVPGDRTYDIALDRASTIGANLPWRGSRVVGLRMLPTITQAVDRTVHVSIDWMRVYAPDGPHGTNPPGDYGTYSIDPLPRPVVDSPNPSEGQDLASAQGRRPWTFTDAGAAAGVSLLHSRVLGFGARGMTAVNAPPIQNDPEVLLPVAPFDASRFHHFSFDLAYDGSFSLEDAPGGGRMARLIWRTPTSGAFQEGDDMVTYSGANAREVQIDLAQGSPLDADSLAPRVGWAGQTVTMLRFDPNEDPGAATWHLRSLHLRADPAAQGSTTVRFHDDAWRPGTRADVLVGRGAPGTPYETIAADIPVAQGVNEVAFDLGGRPAGSYRVQVVLRHPSGGAALAFSKTAITMNRDTSRDPRGALDTVQRAPGGAVVSGWARDPDTAYPLEVHVYSGGRLVGRGDADRERLDVRAAIPGAPLTTGYSLPVALPAGRHDVCVYGIDEGQGENALLGCRSVTIDPAPVGSLDGVERIAGGVRVRGWGIDPQTADPAAVHVYAGPTGTVVSGDQPRLDVARAWPAYGGEHGFAAELRRAAGTWNVCAYVVGVERTSSVGCRPVALDPKPFGSLDRVTRSGGSVEIAGWAVDPDTAAGTDVHIYVNGRPAAVVDADGRRDDVARAFPSWGSGHGYVAAVAAAPGAGICVYAIDTAGGASTTLGCRTV